MFGGFFDKLKAGLTKTRTGLTDKINEMLKIHLTIDEELYEELEEILITADIGAETSFHIIDKVKEKIKVKKIKNPEEVKGCLKEVLAEILGSEESTIIPKKTPEVILVVGVNGVGKTTSIGKMSSMFKNEGYKVLLAAADTFRAAAIDQLEIWSKRSGVDLIRHQEGSDPAAVVFDAVQAAKSRKTEILICDTAGRLHNKKNLMDELAKMNRVIDREYGDAFKQTYLVLDASTGQNAIQQAKQFKEIINIDGLILTKLDGTAKGGIIIPIKYELNIPVKLICIGEGIDDFQMFNPEDFINALL